MKILVLGTPRTSTSVTCELIAQKYQIQNLEYITQDVLRFIRNRNSEIHCTEIESVISSTLLQQDNIVIKSVGGCGNLENSELLNDRINYYGRFDQIVLCSRQNLQNQYHSWLYLESRVSEWIAKINEQMNNVLGATCPEILTWNFSDPSQISDLILSYIPLYQTVPKNFDIRPIRIEKHKINIGFEKKILNFRKLKSILLEKYPDKCCEISYELWQHPLPQASDLLSSALGINVTLSDLHQLAKYQSKIDYTQNIINLKTVNQAYSEFTELQ